MAICELASVWICSRCEIGYLTNFARGIPTWKDLCSSSAFSYFRPWPLKTTITVAIVCHPRNPRFRKCVPNSASAAWALAIRKEKEPLCAATSILMVISIRLKRFVDAGCLAKLSQPRKPKRPRLQEKNIRLKRKGRLMRLVENGKSGSGWLYWEVFCGFSELGAFELEAVGVKFMLLSGALLLSSDMCFSVSNL